MNTCKFLDRWEHGSEFHLFASACPFDASLTWDHSVAFYASGRDAMRALLIYGHEQFGWQRLWIPSYFCQEVAAALLSCNLKLVVYPDSPLNPFCDFASLPIVPGDVLLRVNLFGLRSHQQHVNIPSICVLIEDHTHDPWSEWAANSNADWCIASLRKTLPVPDGAMLWSPCGNELPAQVSPTTERMRASLEKLAAMVLKGLYLQGYPISKAVFRQLQISGESHIATGEISGMSLWTWELLKTFPIRAWRDRRRDNYRVLEVALTGVDWLTMLHPADPVNSTPFSGILVFDSAGRRDYVRNRLIAEDVYPAVLWPLDYHVVCGIPQEHIELSHRVLSVHCDMRYEATDMERVANLVLRFGTEYDHATIK